MQFLMFSAHMYHDGPSATSPHFVSSPAWKIVLSKHSVLHIYIPGKGTLSYTLFIGSLDTNGRPHRLLFGWVVRLWRCQFVRPVSEQVFWGTVSLKSKQFSFLSRRIFFRLTYLLPKAFSMTSTLWPSRLNGKNTASFCTWLLSAVTVPDFRPSHSLSKSRSGYWLNNNFGECYGVLPSIVRFILWLYVE